jgi:hypothetical protein
VDLMAFIAILDWSGWPLVVSTQSRRQLILPGCY